MKKITLIFVLAFAAILTGVFSANAQNFGPLPIPLFQDPVPPQPHEPQQPQPKPQQRQPQPWQPQQPQPSPNNPKPWWQQFIPNGGPFFQNLFPWWQQPQNQNQNQQPQQNPNQNQQPQQNPNNNNNWNRDPQPPQGQPQNPQSGQPWQAQPGPQPWNVPNNNGVLVSTSWAGDRTLNLTWTITNNTNGPWPSSNVDILCAGGTELLTNPKRTRWDIPYTVQRGGQLTFTVNIYQPAPGQAMIFKMMDGGKTLYSFEVRP